MVHKEAKEYIGIAFPREESGTSACSKFSVCANGGGLPSSMDTEVAKLPDVIGRAGVDCGSKIIESWVWGEIHQMRRNLVRRERHIILRRGLLKKLIDDTVNATFNITCLRESSIYFRFSRLCSLKPLPKL